MARVLVTGAAQGLGAALVRRFRARGDDVLATDRAEGDGVDQRLDVTSAADWAAARRTVEERWGGLDVLVNNAGIAGPTAKVEDIKPEDWDRTIAIDLSGMFYCTRKAMPMIKKSGGGSIVNLSSAAGRHGFPQRTPYAAAKWGVVGFTKSLAVEAGPDKVRVNAILPGLVEGERIERVIAAKAKATGVSHEAFRQKLLDTTSLRSTVSAQDIANMALFLCTRPGERITGQAIPVDADVRYLV